MFGYLKKKRMVNDFQLLTDSSVGNEDNFVAHPVNSFLLIKKLTKDFDAFLDVIKTWWPAHLEGTQSRLC